MTVSGGLDKVRFQGNLGDTHASSVTESTAVSDAQWAQYVEVARVKRSEERLRCLHVSSEHGPHAESGEPEPFVNSF